MFGVSATVSSPLYQSPATFMSFDLVVGCYADRNGQSHEEGVRRRVRLRRTERRVLRLHGPDRRIGAQRHDATFQPGDIVDAVSATGTLEAVETVEVGTQVSGVVDELYADFNSIVRKGQVIARLDPQLIPDADRTAVGQPRRARSGSRRFKVSLADARQKLDRARQLAERNLIPRTELETAEVNVKAAEAQIRVVGSGADAGPCTTQQHARQPRLHDHQSADRRHRDLPQRRRGSDGRGEHERADAVRHRRGPHQDARGREHRRVGRGPHAAGTDG